MWGCGQERPLGLFEVLTRNRQSALGLSGCTRSAQEKPNRMCTIPPRQRLSSPTWLAIRRWRVTRGRIRIRIRIIAQVLKLPAPLYNKERKERDTNQARHFTLLLLWIFSLFFLLLLRWNFALKLFFRTISCRPKTRRERFCLSSLLKSRLSLPPPPLSPPFLLFSSKTSCAFKQQKNQLRMSSSGSGGGKKVRMKRRREDLHGIGLDSSLLWWWSRFASKCCIYLLFSLCIAHTIIARAIPPIEVLLFSSSDHHHFFFSH